MKQTLLTGLCAVSIAANFVLGLPALAQESLADLATFQTGCQALLDGRYETAATEFRKTWDELESNDSSDVAKDFVASRLLESLLSNQKAAEAVEWLEEHPVFAPSLSTLRLSALAYQQQHRFAEAAQAYNDLSAALQTPQREIVLNRAICLSLSGREQIAFELLQDKVTPETPGEFLQFAQIANRAGSPEIALEYLSSFVNRDELPAQVRFAALRLRSWLHIQVGNRSAAISETLAFIDSTQVEMDAHKGFLLLEEISQGEPIRAIAEPMESWEENKDHPASEAAGFFRPVFFSPPEDRQAAFEEWLTKDSNSIFAQECRIRLTKMGEEIPENSWLSGSSDLPGNEARIAFVKNSRKYNKKMYEEAASAFLASSTRQTGVQRARSLYNSALSKLQDNNFESFLSILKKLRSEFPDSDLLPDLDYLAGLFLAAEGDLKAVSFLQSFVRENPNHPSNVAAQLALAEIHLNQAPARPQAAREIFDSLGNRLLTLDQTERLDYSRVWLEVVENDQVTLVAIANEFVNNWPSSTYLPEVMMLLAQAQFQASNLESAQVLFDRIATEFPESPFAESAQFFAVRATPAGPEALERWRNIAESETPFSLQGRHEMGLLLLSLDRFEEARSAFESVVGTAEKDSPLHFAALADLAFSYYAEALASNSDKELLSEAAANFARLTNLPNIPDSWRYNASVRRGKCLEALGKPEAALEIYDSIVNQSNATDSLLSSDSDMGSTEWVFRAGFTAIEIMSEQKDWQGAIQMADALSRQDGPRAIDASRLAENLRLRHWIWN